jgi:putative phage-type endonuclease
MDYGIVRVKPDTPEWEDERRLSIGASEIAAVLGLSPWSTPLEVYRSKLGVDRDFDEVLGYIGHASETIIAGWVEQYSDQRGVQLEPAFMARSVKWPWLHASFDRVSHDAEGQLVTWQFKTAHQYGGHHWDEGVPTDIRVQVQGEMAVAGTDEAFVVVWIGGREFRLFVEPRDNNFINDYLVPKTREFWYDRVLAKDAPEPSNVAEIAEVYPTEPGTAIVASETAREAADRRAVLLSDIAAQKAEADALTVILGNYMGSAETLTQRDGTKILTYKTQQGRRSANLTKLTLDFPDVATQVISQGAPFKVMRHAKETP